MGYYEPTRGEGRYVVGAQALPRDVINPDGSTGRVLVQPGQPYPEAFEMRSDQRRAMQAENLLYFVPRVGVDPDFVEKTLLPKLSVRPLRAIAEDLGAEIVGEGKEELIDLIMATLGFAKVELKEEPTGDLPKPPTKQTHEVLEAMTLAELREVATAYEVEHTEQTERDEMIGAILLAAGYEPRAVT